MKTRHPLFLVLVLLCMLPYFGNAQSEVSTTHQTFCNFDEHRQELLSQYPSLANKLSQRENRLQNRIQQFRLNDELSDEEYTIPVVVHIIAPDENSPVNMSYEQVESQIAALNEAFASNDFNDLEIDSGIRFCLAQNGVDEDGNSQPFPNNNELGVMRYYDATLSQHIRSLDGEDALMALTHPTGNNIFPFDRYLNLWVVESITSPNGSTPIGYSPTPLTYDIENNNAENLDGVVMSAGYVGSNAFGGDYDFSNFSFQNGRITIHEVGHYLNLFHTFQNNCELTNNLCNLDGDLICDTDPVEQPNGPVADCGNYPDCNGNTENVTNNYMFYSTGWCMSTFTTEQIIRMQCFLISDFLSLKIFPTLVSYLKEVVCLIY